MQSIQVKFWVLVKSTLTALFVLLAQVVKSDDDVLNFLFLGCCCWGKSLAKHVVDDIVELRTDQCVELACLFDHFGLEMGHPVESTSVRIDLNGWRNLEDDGPGIMQILGLAHCDYSILFLPSSYSIVLNVKIRNKKTLEVGVVVFASL